MYKYITIKQLLEHILGIAKKAISLAEFGNLNKQYSN